MYLTYDDELGVYLFICSFHEKETAKSLGFQWNPSKTQGKKAWFTTNIDVAIKAYDYADNKTQRRVDKELEKRNESIKQSQASTTSKVYAAPNGLKYYPFQNAGIEFLIKHPNALLADEMGAGKSIETIGYINNSNINKVLIVCPNIVKLNWLYETWKWLCKRLSITVIYAQKYEEADIMIINYDILSRYEKELSSIKWDLVVVDECFVYNTKVYTDKGVLDIGYIVENILDCKVLSYNFRKKELEYKKITNYRNNTLINKLLKIKFSNNREVICTENHRIWSNDNGKYKEAIFLSSGESVSFLSESIYDEKQGARDSKVLFKELFFKILSTEKRSERKNSRNKKENKTFEYRRARMFNLWEIFYCFIKREKEILFKKLFCKVENGPTRGEREGLFKKSKRKTGNIEKNIFSNRKRETINNRKFRADEFKQPDEQGTSGTKNDRDQNKERNNRQYKISQRGKWSRAYSAKITSRFTRCGVYNGVSCCDTKRFKKPIQNTDFFQSRYSSNLEETSNRNRWSFTSKFYSKRTRQEKGCSIESTRVESIEVFKQTSNEFHRSSYGENNVYNLEIEDNHNYFANGILVSNCHFIKSAKTKRYEVLRKILKKARRKVFLTGTPILNKPIELWTTIQELCPKEFGSYWQFGKEFCGAKQVRIGYDVEKGEPRYAWDFSGASNLSLLQSKLRSSCMLRRLKKDVLKELPELTRQIIVLNDEEISGKEKDLIEQAKEDYQTQVEALKLNSLGMFEVLSRIRHETALKKVPKVIEFVENILENEGKVVLFGHHKDVLTKFKEKWPDSVLITGDTPVDKRQEAIEQFQNNPKVRLFIGSIQASGVGITLTASSTVVFAELDWVPANISQAESRLLRIGQKNAVNSYHLVFDGTIDAHLAKTIVRKQEIADKSLDEAALDEGINLLELF